MKLFFLFILLFLFGCTSSPLIGPFTVTRVIDGDTLILHTGDTIRLLGIDTPEKDACYYTEAKNKLTSLTLNKVVYLQQDSLYTDRYGRLLRSVFLENGTHVNLLLIEEGYARVYDEYAKKTHLYSRLLSLQAEAQNTTLGLWKDCRKT